MHHKENQHAGGGDGLEDMVGVDDVPNPTGFDAMVEEEIMGVGDREIWLERQHEDLLDVTDSSIFFNDFPPLLDFPCMSSSSSSSSNPAPAKPIASSSSSSSASQSSSAASWAVLKSDAEDDLEKKSHHRNQHNYQHDQVDTLPAALSSTASMEALSRPPDDSMEDVDCMDC